MSPSAPATTKPSKAPARSESPPSCLYCGRLYSDPRGCDWQDGDPKPPTYGTECHPFSVSPTCRNCGAPKGTEHHAYCLQTECLACHRQWHAGLTCDEDAQLTMPGGRAA